MSSVLPLNILDFCLEIRLTVEKAGRPPIHLMTMWHELGGLELSPLWLRPTQADVNPAQDYPEPPHSLTSISHRPCFPLLASSLRHGAKSISRCVYQPHGPLFYVTSYGSGLYEWRTDILEG